MSTSLYSDIGTSEVARLLNHAYSLCLGNNITKLENGYLTAREMVRITRIMREWKTNADTLLDSMQKANAQAFLVRSIRNALESESSDECSIPFSMSTISLADQVLVSEDKAFEVLGNSKLVSAAALAVRDFPEVRWALPGIIPEGLSMISSQPKAGKSWFCLACLKAIASGGVALGRITTTQGHALYISLEDSERRIKDRLAMLGGDFPEQLDILTELPKDVAIAQYIENYLTIHNDTRLVIVDTLGRALHSDVNNYAEMTEALNPLQRLAFDFHTGIVLVHHTKKRTDQSDSDVFDSSLGSQGIFGAMDTTMILERKRGQSDAVLHVVGRDVPDAEYSLSLDTESMRWVITDEMPLVIEAGPEKRKILDIIGEFTEPISTGYIASQLGKSVSTISGHLKKLKDDNLVNSPEYGLWTFGGAMTGATESTESTESTTSSSSAGTVTFGGFGTFGPDSKPEPKVPSTKQRMLDMVTS